MNDCWVFFLLLPSLDSKLEAHVLLIECEKSLLYFRSLTYGGGEETVNIQLYSLQFEFAFEKHRILQFSTACPRENLVALNAL